MLGMSDDFPMHMELESGMNPNLVSQVSVGFGDCPILDEQKTREAGREIYGTTCFVKIAIPGDRSSVFFQPATDAHKRRFPKAWDNYLRRNAGEKISEGLPVQHWPRINRATALNLQSLHIFTVEDLAQVHDGLVDKIPGNGRELRSWAQAHVGYSTGGQAEVTKLASKVEELIAQNKALQNQVLAMQQGNVNKTGEAVPSANTPSGTGLFHQRAGDIDRAMAEQQLSDVQTDVAAAARRPRRQA